MEAERAKCLREMRAGGLTSDQRLACFDIFRQTKPSHLEMEYFYDVWGMVSSTPQAPYTVDITLA